MCCELRFTLLGGESALQNQGPYGKYYLWVMIKILVLIVILYLGYRLFIGPPLLSGRDSKRIRQEKDDDDYTDYEEIV
jgi:hypothetical protein